jgi:hypothetical protein
MEFKVFPESYVDGQKATTRTPIVAVPTPKSKPLQRHKLRTKTLPRIVAKWNPKLSSTGECGDDQPSC